jgi:hypothetical protein
MRIVPRPRAGQPKLDDAWHTELEAALDGHDTDAAGDTWRELRTDVRALTPPMSAQFERQLAERLAKGRESARRQSRRPALRRSARPAAAVLVAAMSLAAAAVIVTRPGGPAGTGGAVHSTVAQRTATAQSGGSVSAQRVGSTGAGGGAAQRFAPAAVGSGAGAKAAGRTGTVAPGASAAANSPSPPTVFPFTHEVRPSGRVQQLAASISLATSAGDIQSIADGVMRLAASEGGYVQSSHVQVQGGTGEANLTLKLPSAKLGTALGALARLAPVRAESQSLQDITDTYDAARQRVADAAAERNALLRALSRASTPGQIDSLRERLAQARAALAQARSAFQAVSRLASTAEVEVTVLGEAQASGAGLTVNRGLHDAGRVLIVTLAVLLIAAAILVPLSLLTLAVAGAWRIVRRRRRERALDTA